VIIMSTVEVKSPPTATHGKVERHDVIVIGGGQAGLSIGYHLARLNISHVVLDAHERIGDSWRQRWDSLRLFTPAGYDGLDGMPFPAPSHSFPTKDDMADYLMTYAKRFNLPVRNGVKVDRVTRIGNRYLVSASELRFEADHVVVAMANYQKPKLPEFARQLDPNIIQLHSSDYRNLSQLREGGVLVAGAGNSGAEIAIEVARSHQTWMAGRDVGYLPFRLNGFLGRHVLSHLVLGFVFNHVLTAGTPIGRRVRPKAMHRAAPLIRVKPRDLTAAGVKRVPRVTGVRDGKPVLENGQVLAITNVIWCTGFNPAFSWIELPVFNDKGELQHERGIVTSEPGLYFVGLHFLYAMSSPMIQGVGRDARYVAERIVARLQSPAQFGVKSRLKHLSPAQLSSSYLTQQRRYIHELKPR
jgi:putative flavoprotein involved in K+ transport